MTRILITGGNGGLGRELVPRLQKAGFVGYANSQPASVVALEAADGCIPAFL
ncbi:MAG TPA: hypothetical protein VI547_06155 [Anaerolineales bacterium]|nr:hypothetical protein [Anaerolineales bacterium]